MVARMSKILALAGGVALSAFVSTSARATPNFPPASGGFQPFYWSYTGNQITLNWYACGVDHSHLGRQYGDQYEIGTSTSDGTTFYPPEMGTAILWTLTSNDFTGGGICSTGDVCFAHGCGDAQGSIQIACDSAGSYGWYFNVKDEYSGADATNPIEITSADPIPHCPTGTTCNFSTGYCD